MVGVAYLAVGRMLLSGVALSIRASGAEVVAGCCILYPHAPGQPRDEWARPGEDL